RFTYGSPHAERLLGYPLGDWLDPCFWQSTLHPDAAAHAIDYCLSESQAGRAHRFDYRMLAADGREVCIRALLTLIGQGQEL
ncbi:PAS domain-containing protein, partial [Pseudomonas paraeruginosa]|uniref:PAS domain-containing protein n=1 Tax=Pseudomonas paraeruginosa TaxID=2994495 RepID=UPI003A4C7B82